MISSAEAPWAVELAGFTKRYRPDWTGRGRCAVHLLTLRLARGQVLGLLGPNGSGKSTTLKALAGLLTPTAGHCRVFGLPCGSDAARACVGYLPDSPQWPAHQAARDFLRYCAGLSGLAGAAREKRVGAVLEWSGLGATAGQRIGTLSRGMAQRLGLAQAMVHEPALVLLDEPANGLDPAGRRDLHRLIQELAHQGTTVVFSSHLLAGAEEVCDRIAILGRGRLLREGTPGELLGAAQPGSLPPSRLEKLYLEILEADERIRT